MAKVATKPNTSQLVTAHANSLHISPRKMRLVTNMVKKLPVEVAIVQLQFTNKKAAGMVVKLLKSAVANAEHNFSIKPEDLVIKEITCDMGQTMKRFFPRARGSAFIIRRKLCHVHVTLEEKKHKGKKIVAINKPSKSEEQKAKQVSTEAGKIEKTDARQTMSVKTNEQIKTNKIRQRRRPQAD